MPDGLKEFFKNVAAFRRGLSTPKRIALVLLTSMVLGTALIAPHMASKPRMVPLYARVEAEDAAKIVEELEKKQIPYELAAGGTSVLVPEENLYELRLQMASQGLPKGGSVGFELFDKNQFGATEFEQQVSLRRAMEGELARSIATVNGVERARVHLVLPRSSVFITKKEQASASVVVELSNPAMFGKKEVAAVVHLVSAAVPGLSRGQVSVVSTEGETLHRPNNHEFGALGTEALSEEAQAVEAQLEQKALAQLERVVGNGGADVRVAVVLDASTREETKETFEPDQTALRSEHETQENTRSESPGTQGIPGARSNLPDNDGGEFTRETGSKNLDTTNRNSRTRNWELDRVLEKIHTPPGRVARLSIAVLLNGSWRKAKGAPEIFEPRSQDEVEQLTSVVKQAVGFDELRGDSISVRAVKFARTEGLDLEGPRAVAPWWKHPYALVGALAFVVLALLLTVILVIRSSRAKKLAARAAAARLNELKEAQQTLRPSLDAEQEPALPTGARLKKLLEGGPEAIAELRGEALQIAGKDPSTTAVVLRTWLEQGRTAEPAPQAAE